jgi:oligo-1,6-glucosidase
VSVTAARPARARPWWHTAVVYQVYPRSFADSDADGVGDLRGILGRLDHLADLGVDVVWLSPMFPSPQVDNGYDVADYTDVDPVFGTLADLDELIDALHARGMRIVLDLVFNHTSDQHPWFQASRSSVDDPKRDWYWWRPPRPGYEPGAPGAEPTNWGAAFSGSAWTYDAASGEYYLGVFSPQQPDLNWEHPEVRRALVEVGRFWLDRGVDGFRLDVINYVSKDPLLPDAEVVEGVPYADGGASYVTGPSIHEHIRELSAGLSEGRDEPPLLIGEMPGVTVDAARRFTDPARGELDMVVQFEHLDVDHGDSKWDPQPFDLMAWKAVLARWQEGLADVGWNTLYLSNHDQPRQVSRLGGDGPHRVAAAKAIATVLHLLRGTPFVYQGEEIGMGNAPLVSLDDLRDVESRNHAAERIAAGDDPEELLARVRPMARDNARTPVQWDASDHAGFTTGTPWMPVDPDHVDVNVADQRDDPTSVLSHYRDLIVLRHTEPLVVDGRFELLLPHHPQLVAFRRSGEAATLLVVANLGGTEVTVDLADEDVPIDGQVLLASGWDGAEDGPVVGSVGAVPSVLPPWASLVLRAGS